MYASMSHHHQFAYGHPPGLPGPPPQPPQQQQQAPRQYSNQGTSSAFSASANPDEDWTKISDLAERRRIQNRIAQRNYRRKLKKRIEALERRAGEGESDEHDGSPPAPESEEQPKAKRTSKKGSKGSKPTAVPTHQYAPQSTPPMQPEDEFFYHTTYDARQQERSHTPPYSYNPSGYPPPQEVMGGAYGGHSHYQHPMTTSPGYSTYLATDGSLTLPPMNHFSEAIKREPYVQEEPMPAYMGGDSYYMNGMDVNAPGAYDHHSNPHTPPLSHSYDHSPAANVSDGGYGDYTPVTPCSMPRSPGMMDHHA